MLERIHLGLIGFPPRRVGSQLKRCFKAAYGRKQILPSYIRKWDIAAVTLTRFYALHIMVLPAAILLFLVGHFLMIRRQGIARPL